MSLDYCSLHSHSTYSFLDGYGHPKDLVERVKELGMDSVALTDHGSVSGHPLLEKYALENGIHPVFGNEFYLTDDITAKDKEHRKKYHLTVLAKTQQGYSNLLKLTTSSYAEGFYYKPSIDENLLFSNSEGLIVFSGCLSGRLQQYLVQDDYESAHQLAERFKYQLDDNFYLETQHYPQFKQTYQSLYRLSEQLKIPVIATIDNHYFKPEQGTIREILWSIRDRRQFNPENVETNALLMTGDELYSALKLIDPIFNWIPSIEISQEIAQLCNVILKKGSLPSFPVPGRHDGKTAYRYLAELCVDGLKKRGLYDKPEYQQRLKYELGLIHEKNFENYFLIVWDVINWAKENDILVGPGRGSSASSLVAYCLRITEADPIEYSLIFERFIALDRLDLPDIDIDFEDSKRYLVKEYLQKKYGNDHVVQLGTFAAFKGKNSLDEVGKSFSIPANIIKEVKSFLIDRSGGDMRADICIADTFEMSPRAKEISKSYSNILYSADLEGQYRHMSSHAAGALLSAESMDKIIGFYRKEDNEDSMPVSSVDYDGAKYLDLIKLDLLGLTELTMIHDILDLAGIGIENIYDISLDDEKTLSLFNKTDVLGIFQAEGESTKSVLRQMHVNKFWDIIDAIALSKPGPAHSGATSNYLSRKNGREADGYDGNLLIAQLTSKTYGQLIYQEQIMRIIKDIGQMTIQDVEIIRRLISKSQGEEVFGEYWPRFKHGAMSQGLDENFAEKLWGSIKTHGRWSFNLAHSVVYAMVTFWSGWTKAHYPQLFYMVHIKHEGDDRNKRKLMQEAIRKGFKILGPRFGYSKKDWSIDQDGNLRAGLLEIKGVGEKTAEILSVIEDFNNNDIPKRIRTIIDKNNQFLEEQDDYFNLQFDPKIVDFHGTKCIDIDWDDQVYNVRMAVSVFELNFKDYAEEQRSRGHDTSNIKNPELMKYLIFMGEDNSDTVMFQMNRYNYPKYGQVIWDAYNNKTPILVEGQKIKGWRIINCKIARAL